MGGKKTIAKDMGEKKVAVRKAEGKTRGVDNLRAEQGKLITAAGPSQRTGSGPLT